MTLITLEEGDITELVIDAIVNAANERLILGSGVAGAIRLKGGPGIQQECDRQAPIKTGQTAVTSAGDLPQKWIIHAVAPQISMKNWEPLLAETMRNIFRTAQEKNIASVGVPALGTGVFGLPMDRAAKIMISTAREMAKKMAYPHRLIFCLFGQEAYALFRKALDESV